MLKDNELIGKFIRYSPEISEEIYNKMLKKIEANGFKKWLNSYSYEAFKNIGVLNITREKTYFIPSSKTNTEDVEISYKDIIGYIPEYVECLEWTGEFCRVREIYPIVKYNENILYCTCKSPHYTSGVIGCNSGKFKFSTKEAYEAQFKKEWWKDLKAGDYVVALNNSPNGSEYYTKNHIYNIYGKDGFQINYTTNRNWKGGTKNYEDFRIATPDEIAMFLAAGKPVDVTTYKIPEEKPKFEVGKWYKWFQGDHNSYHYGKFKRFANGSFYASPWIVNSNNYNSQGCFDLKFADKIEEISVDVIQKFLPEGHIDKIKSFNVHDKCNIGDIIVSLKPKSIYIDTRKNGDLLKVLEASNKNSLYYKRYAYITKEDIDTYRLATAQEIELFNNGVKNIYDVKEQFKVGDWVYADKRADDDYRSDYKNGNKFIPLFQIDEIFQEVWARPIRNQASGILTKFLRKATPEEIQKSKGETKYFDDLSQHIGRYIKALVDYPNAGAVKKGEIGIVVGKDKVDFPSQKGYACDPLRKENKNKYELMPESYAPEGEFVLPEKWCIRFKNREQFNALNKYFGKLHDGFSNHAFTGTDRAYSSDLKYNSDIAWFIERGYKELTFEQFEKYVLNQEPKKDNMEELLEEAKQRFPIGTKFNPAHLNQNKEYCIITNTKFEKDIQGDIIALTDEGKRFDDNSKYGNTIYNRIVYCEKGNKWANIMTSTQEKPFKAGDKLVGRAIEGSDITMKGNPLGKKGEYTIADRVEYDGSRVKLWAEGAYWPCEISDISLYQEKSEKKQVESPPKTESWSWTIIDMSAKKAPELILKDEDESVIFPNIKKERIVEIKIKLVD